MQGKEIEREIANGDNDLINFLLKGLNPSELDIFLGIYYRCQRQETRTAKITFDELRGLSYFLVKDNERFQDRVLAVSKKLSSLSFEINNGSVYYGFSFFSMYRIDTNNEYIEIAINEHLSYLLNDFKKNSKNMDRYKLFEADKRKEPKEEQCLDDTSEPKTEMEMFPEDVPFFD